MTIHGPFAFSWRWRASRSPRACGAAPDAARRDREARRAPRTGAREKRSRGAPGADRQGYRRVDARRIRRGCRREPDARRHQGARSPGAPGQPSGTADRGLRRARDRSQARDLAGRGQTARAKDRPERLAHRAAGGSLERLRALSPLAERRASVRRQNLVVRGPDVTIDMAVGHGVCCRDS